MGAMNRGEEDYIKAIHELEYGMKGGGLVTNLQLSLFFSHTAQTVNEMIKKLAKKNMVNYIPYKGSVLTEEGRRVAARMIRVHRIWETFLVDKLGYSWDEVHEEAECLEHITTEKLEEKLFVFLGKPQTCPHGNLIHGINEVTSESDTLRLIDATTKEHYCLKRVIDNKVLLTYLNLMDIHIGQQFEIKSVDSISEIIMIQIDSKQIAIGYKVAMQLYISHL